MNSRSHQLLRVHYRCLQTAGFSALWASGAEARREHVQPDQATWVAMERMQWVPAELEGPPLETALRQQLQRIHPGAKDLRLERVCVLRRGKQFLAW